MRYTLSQQIISKELIRICRRQKTADDLGLERLTKQNLREYAEVIKEIEKDGCPKRFVIKKLKGNIGRGVFLHPTARPIEKGEIIGPYAGEVSLVAQNDLDDADYAFDPVVDLLLTKEEQKRYDPKNKYHPRRYYAFKLDAKRKGNFTRFINHSYKPNVIAYLASTPGMPYQIIYVAKKKIQPGHQLLVSYEDGDKSYWGAIGIEPFPMTSSTFRIDKRLKIIEKRE